jgi:hypothetical protein
MKRYNVITKLLIPGILIAALSFSACKKDDEFNVELVSGEYTGSLTYWTAISDGGVGNSRPDLSKGSDYKTTITKVGSNYILSFDKSFIYLLPDISIEITRYINSEMAAIGTLVGQDYTSTSAVENVPNQPPNYFSISKYPQRIDCNISLRSNAPDSTYFLTLKLFRIY